MNIPNMLTLARIALMPVLVLCFEQDPEKSNFYAASIMVFAAITDFIDGYIARAWNQKTLVGAVLDPIADKVVILIGMVLLVTRYQSPWILGLILIMLSREFIVSGLRESAASQPNKQAIPVNQIGKVKTCAQMIAMIALMLFYPVLPEWVFILGMVALVTATVFSLISLCQYSIVFVKTLS